MEPQEEQAAGVGRACAMGSVGKIVRGKRHLFRSAVVLGALVAAFLTGCHTTAGFGQDMQSAGRNLQNSANKANK